MQDTEVLKITRITDSDTGIDGIGDLGYEVPMATKEWLKNNPTRRDDLAVFLKDLARKLYYNEPPFEE